MAVPYKPTYFTPPTFHNPPDGPLKLGQLITAVDDPGNALDKPEPFLPHEIETYGNEQSVKSHGYSSSSHVELGLVTRAVQAVAVKAGVTLSATHHGSILSHIERLQIRFIQPDDDYVERSLLRPKVHSKLKRCLWQKRAFMITGICIAHPSAENPDAINLQSGAENRAQVDAQVGGPAGAGSTGSGANSSVASTTSHFLSLIPREPFVYAFQLRECRYGRRRVTNRSFTDGALLKEEGGTHIGRDTSLATQYENPEAFEFVFDELADEEASLDELGLDGTGFTLLEGNNEATGLSCDIVLPI